MTRFEARRYRRAIETCSQSLTDETAIEVAELFPDWDSTTYYKVDQRVRYEGILYRCLQAHTAQESWTPVAAPSLWAKVLIPDENMIPEWEQPSSTNGYSINDKVMHNGKTWISLVDNNVWEPGAIGTENLWKEYLDEESEIPEDDGVEIPSEDNNEGETNVNTWVQPNSTNPYQIGDVVTHNGKTWECTCANNVWEPGVYGWKEI